MTGKTHIAVGAASALALAHAGLADPTPALACLAAGAVGGLLPDADVASSEASRQLRRAWALLAVVVAAAAVADGALGFALLPHLALAIASLGMPQVAGIAILVAVCACGRASGHRGFSHSLVALAASHAAVRLALPTVAAAVAVGYASHLALDLLNKKPERLLWPMASGQRLGLFKSGGLADALLFVAGIGAAALLLAGLR
jgi:inner membrane protein